MSAPVSVLPPSSWITRFAHLLPDGGSVLDLACGSGRHARWLAARGLAVTAVDRDAEAIAALTGLPGIEALAADLEGAPWPLAGRRFDGIVVTNYLHRPLWPLLAAALAPRGMLLYETFMAGNERFGKPSRPDFLLQPGELLEVCRQQGLQVVAYEAGEVEAPKAAMVQRLCAVRGDLPRLPGRP